MADVIVRAIRGATTVASNDAECIAQGTAELVAEIISSNQLDTSAIISIIFTSTADLNATFPAIGARNLGLNDVPLFCATEIPVPGSLKRCIRCLVHINTNKSAHQLKHVYLHDAYQLRPDLAGADDESSAGNFPAYRSTTDRIVAYVPGKPIEEVRRELGLSDVVKLASNENSLGPSPQAMAAFSAVVNQLHRYPDGAALELRAALAGHLNLPMESLFIGNGSDEVIKLLAEAYLEPGDEVIFAAETFSEYAYATRLMGAVEKRVPLRHGQHDLEAILKNITERTKLIFICNPNNPTGTYVSTAAVKRFLHQLPAGVLAIFDEAYVEYVDAPDFPDTLALLRAGWPVVSLRTFSKIYGLAGLRIGYCAAPEAVAERLFRVKEPFNVNLPAQIAAIAALADVEHLKRSKEINSAGKLQLYTGLNNLGIRYWPSQANFICFDLGRPSQPLYEAMLKQGVIVRATASFGLPTALRVTVGTQQENELLLRALTQVLA